MPQLEITDHCKIIRQLDNIRLSECDKDERVENYKWNKYKWKDDYANIFIETLNSFGSY